MKSVDVVPKLLTLAITVFVWTGAAQADAVVSDGRFTNVYVYPNLPRKRGKSISIACQRARNRVTWQTSRANRLTVLPKP